MLPRFRALIGMGGNLGEVDANMRSAVAKMGALPWTELESVSSVYRSTPVDAQGPDYLNAVVALQSSLGPRELLRALQQLEADHDRTRPYHHAPRTLDLDLLCFGDARVASTTLVLPHPRMLQRAFVLEPLSELTDEKGLGWPVGIEKMPADARQKLASAQGISCLGPL